MQGLGREFGQHDAAHVRIGDVGEDRLGSAGVGITDRDAVRPESRDGVCHVLWAVDCRPSHSPGRTEIVSAGRLGNIRLDHRTRSLAGAWRQIETLSPCVAIRVSWIAPSSSSLNVLGVRRLHWLCLTGSRSPRRMLPCHFPLALACYGGDRRRGRGQIATLAASGRLSRPLLLGRRDHPSQRHLFADLPRGGPVEDLAELRFRQPALRCQARRPGTHAHCRAQGPGRQGGRRQHRGRLKRPHLRAAG